MTGESPALWGVIGGMGPLVSAEFMKTVYGRRHTRHEQEQPRVVMLSDPAMPDRTAALLGADGARELVKRLEDSLRAVMAMGATRTAICCVTIHAVLPRLSPDTRRSLVSLVDLAIDAMEAAPGRHLVLCTRGTRHGKIFESHPRWAAVAARVVFPAPDEQQVVHDMVYRLKNGFPSQGEIERHGRTIEQLMHQHAATTYVAGCTELHLLSAALAHVPSIDPLGLLADAIHATHETHETHEAQATHATHEPTRSNEVDRQTRGAAMVSSTPGAGGPR
jgi:aspartate racemase